MQAWLQANIHEALQRIALEMPVNAGVWRICMRLLLLSHLFESKFRTNVVGWKTLPWVKQPADLCKQLLRACLF